MTNDVFANGREISCKSGEGKSICAFPDVCFTPPENPATPPGVPIPYPNTGLASDTSDGSRSVKISHKEIMLKNKSYFKKSIGDEAGCAAKKGVVTSVHRGKVYFIAWSMDVKAEGENVVRHLDMTTHNHASPTPNSPPTAHLDAMAVAEWSCEKFEEETEKACEGAPQRSVVQSEGKTADGKRHFNIFALGPDQLAAAKEQAKAHPSGQAAEVKHLGRDCSNHPDCAELQKCVLKPKEDDKTFCCHPRTTGHHLVEGHGLCQPGSGNKPLPEFPNYKYQKAPCVCVEGSRFSDDHGKFHAFQGVRENAAILMTERDIAEGRLAVRRTPDRAWSYRQARDAGLDAHEATFPGSLCKRDCLAAQLDEYHKQHVDDDTLLRTEKNSFHKESDQLGEGLRMTYDRFDRFMASLPAPS